MRISPLALVAAAGCSAALVLTAWSSASRPTVRVDAGPVGEQIAARAEVVAGGELRHVFANADGRVLRVPVQEGDRVEQGQTLAELEIGGATQRLAAPMAAIVLGRSCEAGDHVVAAERAGAGPLFVLADASRIELRVEVEALDAPRLALDLPARIGAVGAKKAVIAGKVTRVAARLERRSIGSDDARVRADGLVRVATVAFTADKPDWPVGTRAEVMLEVSRRDAATRLPRAALSVRDGRHIVEQPLAFWAREVAVEVLAVDEAYAEIRGLTHGSEVLVR
jgi:Biotin-lipoyl like